MCRYAFKTYKSHFACFKCKKAFKQVTGKNLLKQNGEYEYYKKILKLYNKNKSENISKLEEYEKKYFNRTIKCPVCNSTMADLGLDFKPPRKTRDKEWKIIESMYITGHSFLTCGCNGPGYIPTSKNDYMIYLNEILETYENNYKYSHNRISAEDRNEARAYWAERINLVKKELLKM